MITIQARNPHRALSHALYVMDERGVRRDSRNGPVIVAPFPVTTEYTHPTERVVFWPQRDANPFYHLYEALWMLSGSKSIVTLKKFASNVVNFSDDGGRTWHGAYGHRWKRHFGHEQLDVVVGRLRNNPDDRRCVIQMWDPIVDLDRDGLDVPCNVVATAQRDAEGRLDLTVFCRSNDIIWGTYGANCVHFSVLQEYLAQRIDCPVGTYRQVSVNWHAYVDKYETLRGIPRQDYADPYSIDFVRPVPMVSPDIDGFVRDLMHDVDREVVVLRRMTGVPWHDLVNTMMAAHQVYRTAERPENYYQAINRLHVFYGEYPDLDADWISAGLEWLKRRLAAHEEKHGL